MDSDQSYSGDSSSSTGTSSGSSEAEDEVLEPVKILGHTFELPQDLCEDYGLFKEFFSMKTWDSLDDKHKDHLKNFLPKFSSNEEEEREKTINMLFNREPFHFTSPLNDFYHNLKQGNYRPDIAKMKKFLLKARAKQQKHKVKSYYAKLLPEVLISKERLLAAVNATPPGPAPRLPLLPPKPSSKNNYRPPHVRAKQRYFEELAAVRSEVGGQESEDENYPEGPVIQPSRKRAKLGSGQNSDIYVSGTLGGNDPTSLSSLECLKNVLAAHRARRQYRENHPELNTTGIMLNDIKQRVALVNGAKKLMFGGPKSSDTPIQKLRRGPKKDSTKTVKTEPKQPVKIKEETIDNADDKSLLLDVKIKCELNESDSESSSFVDPVSSPRSLKRPRSPEVEIKQEVVDIKYPDSTNIQFMDPDLESPVKQENPDSMVCQPVPIKLEDLDGIDMMALPVELADESGEVSGEASSGASADSSLTHTTYANFLCVVRALFPAASAHRAPLALLHSTLAAVIKSPVAPLNAWYSLSEDWCAELDSALEFLAGERGPHPDDFVPYLQFIPDTQMYQWIGAGRDSDTALGRLCERWRGAPPAPPDTAVPPPISPTTWVSRAATPAEVAEFRIQERKRFASPSKPFTYVQHGYRSVVGPSRVVCGRVPLGAVLRDALARLPNGHGTLTDIMHMLRMSQYLPVSEERALSVSVGAALERLRTTRTHPAARYDPLTARWTYLHRNRNEEDWLKIIGKTAKINSTSKQPASPPPPRPQTPPTMDMEVALEEVVENASDSDVDVDDSGDSSSTTHLSSAQLLRQATLGKETAVTSPRPVKTKLTPAQPLKPKAPPKNTSPKSAKPTQPKQATQQSKPQSQKQSTPQTKPTPQTKQVTPQTKQTPQQSKPAAPQTKQTTPQTKQIIPQNKLPAQTVTQQKVNVTPVPKPRSQSPKAATPKPPNPPQKTQTASPKTPSIQTAQIVKNAQIITQAVVQNKQGVPQTIHLSKASPTTAPLQHKSPVPKQRPLQKLELPTTEIIQVPSAVKQDVPTTVVQQAPVVSTPQTQNKVSAGTRSLLLRPPVQTTANTAITTQVVSATRRGLVRVLSPATPAAGKSLISPRALLTHCVGGAGAARRVSEGAAGAARALVAGHSLAHAVKLPAGLHLAGGQSVQLSQGQSVQLSQGQSVQLAQGHSVQLASGQTVQLSSASPMRLATPVQTVQLAAGQTVQLPSGQTVQLPSGQTVQLPSGQTVQLPSGQTVQLPSGQTVQLPSGQTIQLPTSQTLQLPTGQRVQLPSSQTMQLPSNQTVQLPGGQTVQLSSNQTVQLPSSQTVQLSSGQTLQLSGGQTVQLPNGQTLQLSGQALQLSGQQKAVTQHIVRPQAPTDKPAQPIVAKLLTNAQGQMLSLEGVVVGSRGKSPGVRVLTGARLARPLILAAGKPLTNIILQQSDGSAIRVTSSGGTTTSQAIVLSTIGGHSATTSTTGAPVLKLQQVNALQQVKLPQGIKIQQPGAVSTSGGAVRSVLMDTQQLKLVGGRHVLARLLRPSQPPPH